MNHEEIFAAFNSAKVMVVLGTRQEYFNAVWVRNEWSRYLSLIRNGAKKVLIPAYRDMDPYDLPEEFSHLQAQDMSKLGFMQDLIRGIKKIIGIDDRKAAVAIASTNNTENGYELPPLLKRAYMCVEDGEWKKADECFERALDKNPECVQAYLGKLMVENHVTKQEQLIDCAEPFDGSYNYQKVIHFADEILTDTLVRYNKCIRERNEKTRKENMYDNSVKQMKKAKNEAEYKAAAESFRCVSGYLDADSLAEECLVKADIAKKNEIMATYYSAGLSQMKEDTGIGYKAAAKSFKLASGYLNADSLAEECLVKAELAQMNENATTYYAAGITQMNTNTVTGYQAAIKYFEKIPGWKDVDELTEKCRWKMEEIKKVESSAQVENENKERSTPTTAEKKHKKTRRKAMVGIFIAVLIVLVIIIAFFVFR